MRLHVHLLLIEITHGHQHLLRTDNICTVEQLAGNGGQFTQNHIVIGFGVADDVDIVDSGLFTFTDTDFNVNGVTVNARFHRIGTEKQVAVIHVERCKVLAVLLHGQVLCQNSLIIDISFVDS